MSTLEYFMRRWIHIRRVLDNNNPRTLVRRDLERELKWCFDSVTYFILQQRELSVREEVVWLAFAYYD